MKLGKMVQKLRLSSDSLILLKEGTEIAQPEAINNLVGNIEKTDLSNVILMVVADFDDIRVMDERQMNEHGWFRAPALRKLIHVPIPETNGGDKDVEIDV
jgi:hypothetical protein